MDYLYESISNPYTLNIFTDASMHSGNGAGEGCYGALARCMSNEIDSICRIQTYVTTPECELKGIRAGVELAIKYKDQYSKINIFSDSQLSVFGLRDRIYKWRINNNKIIKKDKKQISYQDIYTEIIYMIADNDVSLNIYHTNSHIDIHNKNSIKGSINNFIKSNYLSYDDKVEFKFMKYISLGNNEIDRRTRSLLKSRMDDTLISEPIYYIPDYRLIEKMKKYKKQVGGYGYEQ